MGEGEESQKKGLGSHDGLPLYYYRPPTSLPQMDSFSLEPTLPTLDLRLLASRVVRDEIPAVLSPIVQVICYSDHGKLTPSREDREELEMTPVLQPRCPRG